ncbi:hypothetical protein VB773_15550 [Haloarculaceae archaeon H-GB2-1]|nr:hypothetical protein [Haloarculaceae archaeon H-GB1-1]MEA5387370.1 hypothetical protein [Haloarculaceae archaeon H-GB11]MEA5408841.1 hypothetical protein [Haloarculaceae archaeon H-GB2-1]
MNNILSTRAATTASAVLVVVIGVLEWVVRPLVSGAAAVLLDAIVVAAAIGILVIVGVSFGQELANWLSG